MTVRSVVVQPSARADLDELVRWYRDEAGADVADRFVTAADASFAALAATPGLGPPIRSSNPKLQDVRKWRVRDFQNVMIFYIADAKVIVIVRVLHAARDWWGLLGVDEG